MLAVAKLAGLHGVFVKKQLWQIVKVGADRATHQARYAACCLAGVVVCGRGGMEDHVATQFDFFVPSPELTTRDKDHWEQLSGWLKRWIVDASAAVGQGEWRHGHP